MKKINLTTDVTYMENHIANLRGKMATNAISEETRNEVEATITRMQQIVDDMKAAQAAAEEGTDDKSEELRSQVNELMASIRDLENKVDAAAKVENFAKKVTSSKKFVEAFYNCVKKTNDPKEFKNNWYEVAKKHIQNNIDAGDISEFLPGFMINEIRDAFVGKRHRILELVDWTGLRTFKSMWETGNDLGNVHTRGNQKTEQTLEFTPITIRPDLVYKYIQLDKVVEKEAEQDGRTNVLIEYVMRELLDRLLATIENLILTGTSPFAAPEEKQVDTSLGSESYNALAYMEDTTDAVAIMGKSVYLAAKNSLATTYNRLITHDDVLAYFGVQEIIFNESTYTPTTPGATWAGVWLLRPADYKMVGDRRPDSYEGFNLAYNQDQYLIEMFVGGACVVPDNFVALYTI